MTVRRILATLLAIGVLAPPLARADWIGKGEAGALLARGNTDATSANFKLDLSREANDWKNGVFVGALYGKNASFSTAQRIEARWQIDYNINERLFWFSALRGEQDRFSGFKYQATASTGSGYKFVDSEDTKFSGTIGAGYRRSQSENLVRSPEGEVLDRLEGETEGDIVGSGSLNFEYRITGNTKLLDKTLVEYGSSNTTAANDFAVQVSMTEKLALSVGYGVRYNTDPPPGAQSTDQLTTVNLVYTIK